MMKVKYVTGLLLLSLTAVQMQAQDVHFSQINESQLFLSPANTGFFNGYFRATANYRNQWSAMNKAFNTTAIALDGGLFRSKKRPAFMGIGLSFFNDQAGAAKLRRTNILLNVSGLLKIGSHSAISVGLAGGTMGVNANYSSLTYESQFNGNGLDPALNSSEPIYRQFTTVDVGAGVAYEYSNSSRDSDHDDMRSIRVSLGAYHLNRPAQEFGPGSKSKEAIRYTASLFSTFDVEDTRLSISPTVVYHRQSNYEELTLGTNVRYRMSAGTKVTGTRVQNAIGLGLYYRKGDALIPMLTFDAGDYSFGVSYDVNLSGYRTASSYRGGFEISLRYNDLASSLFQTRREFR